MAEPDSVADKTLKNLADLLECSICCNSFTNPKQLQCFHIFCKDCLDPIVLQDLSLCCPNCSHSTLLPANGVSGLQPAFHIHYLFRIQDALKKAKQEQKIQCYKCKKREANRFCRDCGILVCKTCTDKHQSSEEGSTKELISLEQLLKSEVADMMHSPRSEIYQCSQHQGNSTSLSCETDWELCSHSCIAKVHCNHKYILTFCQDVISSNVDSDKQQSRTTSEEAMQSLDTARDQIVVEQVAIRAEIESNITTLHETLEVRKTELIGHLEQITQQKLNILSDQRDDIELIQTQLNSFIEFVSDSLKTGCGRQILTMKKPVMEQAKELCAEHEFSPQVQADMALTASSELLLACQQFGKVCISQVHPEKCCATGKALEVATVGEQSTATVYVVDNTQGSQCYSPSLLSCELVKSSDDEKMKCNVIPSKANQFEVNYRPTHRGRHQLHIKVADQHIRGSPFTIVVNIPIKAIPGINRPHGVAINEKEHIVVAERGGCCISIYSPHGEKIKSFGKKGSAPGQFLSPCGVAVDRAGNILVVDGEDHHIQKFTADGMFLATVGCHFDNPVNISISPCGKIYVCDCGSHRIQVLHPDLTFCTCFGDRGSYEGKFLSPCDVAFDSQGNVYVADSENHRIQVFTEYGHFLRKFGRKGKAEGELNWPASIAINSDDVVYIAEENNNRISLFTSEGHFLKSFPARSDGPGLFEWPAFRVAINEDGVLFISDQYNNCLLVRKC